MRISDGSLDVCSADLTKTEGQRKRLRRRGAEQWWKVRLRGRNELIDGVVLCDLRSRISRSDRQGVRREIARPHVHGPDVLDIRRGERWDERRVGTEGVSKCKHRGCPIT